MRLGVYTDYAYELVDGEIRAERAFALFVARLGRNFETTTLIGRVRSNETGNARYSLGSEIGVVPLPYYESLSRPSSVIGAMLGSIRAFWRGLENLDTVWLLGPHPLAIAFALCAHMRGRKVVLGVRQDLPTYARTRHPGRRSVLAIAWSLEIAWRVLARFFPVVVVGPDLAERYRRSGSLLEILVSLVGESEIVAEPAESPINPPLKLLTVGRIDTEKNPMLLAEVISDLEQADPGRFQLEICGEGPREDELRERITELGITEVVEFRGYVSWGPELTQAYRDADLLLHVSLTEGMPQVLLEAFAAGLPVVATDVGGIRAAVGDCVELIPAEDPDAAVHAIRRLEADPQRREQLSRAGLEFIRRHTLEAETAAVAKFLTSDAQ